MKRTFAIIVVAVLAASYSIAQAQEKNVQKKASSATVWDTLAVPSAGISISSRTLLQAPQKLISLYFAKDGRIIANSSDEIYVWSPTGQLLKTLSQNQGPFPSQMAIAT